jgi:hypothetical protein
LSTYAVAVWGLTADLGFSSSFPWSTGPLSNWMVWLGFALVANLSTFLRPSESPAERNCILATRFALEELTIAKWPLALEEEQTPGPVSHG